MAAQVSSGALPGIVTLIAQGDEVDVDPIGTVALHAAEPMRPDTIFRIASMTKPILAAATMILVEDGTIRLDEPIDRLLPEMANPQVLRRVDGAVDDTVPAVRPITVDDLLTFRFGWGHVYDPAYDPPIDPPIPILSAASELRLTLGPPDPRTPHDPDEWIRRFASLPLMYQPGERWMYNAGSLVLGVLVARAAGRSLPDFLDQRIFTPLGMTSTGFQLPDDYTGTLPTPYATDPATGKLAVAPDAAATDWTEPPAFPSGAGGLLSTANDFLAFARVLLHDGAFGGTRILSPESVHAITTNHLTAEQRSTGDPILAGNGWGYGVVVVTEPDEFSAVPGRYGWDGGYGTAWFNDPHRDLIGIALTQVHDFLVNGGSAEFEALALDS